MGNQANCALKVDGKRYEGKALLETSELIFRGPEHRLKIAFGDIREVASKDGELRVRTKSGLTIFEIGDAAEKWREKILHPKSRIEKLGVKPGMLVAVLGNADAGFAQELSERNAEIARSSGDRGVELTFLFVEEKSGLTEFGKVARKLKDTAGLWVVYPKGRKEITEANVIDAGRTAGLKDVKVVGFSATQTALKFVLPVKER